MAAIPRIKNHAALAGWAALAVVFAIGVFLRVHTFEKPESRPAFDESVYGAYVTYLDHHGIASYPALVAEYVEKLKTSPIVFLPPTRASFLLAATLWHKIFGVAPVEAVRAISCLASILTLALSGLIAGRAGGWKAAFGVMALMAFAPTQISMAHRAFIDGFFGLLALLAIWSLWEALRSPQARWHWLFGLSTTLLILTKENAAFVYAAMLVILGVNPWAKFGQVTRPLLVAALVSPIAALILLAVCAGGFPMLLTTYLQNVTMNYVLPYGLANQDGPWFRYLTDLVLVSPAVMLFAIGGAFLRLHRGGFTLFLVLFIVVTYILMGNIRYGMNLRFANMWDFPLRWLAMAPILIGTEKLSSPKAKSAFYFGATGILCLLEFFNYLEIFVHNQVYDPISINLMRALDMIK